ncbi:class I adenylate-forming enzyme family protein [Subtercola sp. YIM 133946]|uniref:class I adenylate-forming enzyme family protein n=1 Tax=Subtercola sp. YIM 133946 TaxID=3118909 RepID=UPI002F91F51D
MIIADLIRRSLRDFASNTAISNGVRAFSYAEVGDRSHRLVNALRARGFELDDRIATLGANDVTTLEWMLGLALGGFNRVALHAMNSSQTHREMIAAAGARVLIVDGVYYDKIKGDSALLEALDLVIVRDSVSRDDRSSADDHDDSGFVDYETMLAESDATDAHVDVTPDTLLHLAYSSGSGGSPRASMHSHSSWVSVTLDNAALLPRVTSDDIYLAAAPLTHAASTVVYLLLSRGAGIRVMPHFEPGEALAIIEQERCSIAFMVPTMLQMLASHPDVATRDLSSIRALMYAGAPISVETARKAQVAFGTVLFQSYGQSECLPATCLTPEDHARGVAGDESILRSAGRACLNADVRIANENGAPLGVGEIGEILVSTAGRMLGIYGDPEQTARRITADGFVRSSDIGYIDERGLLFVVDRKDDMIISGGFNIWPAEIENALLRHPDVIDVVAVGVPHPRWGETPHAVVVLAPGAAAEAADLIAFCSAQIGSMKKPTELVVTSDALPRNELGKRSRRLIKDLYWPSTTPLERQVSGA